MELLFPSAHTHSQWYKMLPVLPFRAEPSPEQRRSRETHPVTRKLNRQEKEREVKTCREAGDKRISIKGKILFQQPGLTIKE